MSGLNKDISNSYREFPMTDIQSAYWVGRRDDVAMGGVSTHIYEEVEFIDLDLDHLESSWNRIIQRHEMLRSLVSSEGLLRIYDQAPYYNIPHDDLRGLTRPEQEDRIKVIRERHLEEVLPSDTWPLWRVRTAQITDRTYRVFLSFDAIPCDARSRSIMYEDWKILYQDPTAELDPLTGRFGEFLEESLAHQDTEEFKAARDFWRERIPDLPMPPSFPAYPPDGGTGPRFKRLEAIMPPDLWQACKQRCEAWGVKPTPLLTAIFGKVITAWSNDPRFHIILTIFERLGHDPRYQKVVGDFTSTLILPIDCSHSQTVEGMARQVRDNLKELLPKSNYSGIRVMRDLGNSGRQFPENAIPCVLTSTVGSQAISRKEWRTDWMGKQVMLQSQTPQVGIDFQIFQINDELRYNWDYATHMVSSSLAESMFQDFKNALETVARSGHLPEIIDQKPGVSEEGSKNTDAGFLYDDIAGQVNQRPDAPAIITDQTTLTYQEMSDRAMWIGKELVRLGAQRDELVAIVMNKGWEQVVAALGIHLAGAAYLPIDATTPNSRIHHILERGEVNHVLTTSDIVDSLELPEDLNVVEVDHGGESRVPMESLVDSANPGDLAYVIFTSGSTGKPKGVAMEHRATRNTINDVNDRLDVRSSDRILAVSSLSFDLSVYDIFGLLCRGGAIVIPSQVRAKDPSEWARLLEKHKITLWNSVPTLAQLLFEQFQSHPESAENCRLRTIMMSGDWIPVPLPDQLRGMIPNVEIISMGGATEAAIWSVIHHVGPVDPSWRSIPYGRSMRNQTIEVRDQDLKMCEVGEIGEIVIGGTGLARGYWRDEDLTNDSFVRHSNGLRFYKTGDLGRYENDGKIEFLGRMDHQVKIRGFRIEIGEVEHAISSHPDVSNCIVKAAGPPCGERRLVAYLVAEHDESPIDFDSICQHVALMLPEYMVPVNWHWMKELPLGANGKVDRSTDLDALVSEWAISPGSSPRINENPNTPDAVVAAPTSNDRSKTDTVPEAMAKAALNICNIAEDVLGMPGIKEDSDLIDLGANSVDVIRIANRIETAFGGTRPQLDDIYDAPTPAGIARLISAVSNSNPRQPVQSAPTEATPAAFEVLKDPADRKAFRNARKGRRPDANDLDRIALPRNPDLERTLEQNNRRRSYRCFDQNPIKFAQLGRVLECLADSGQETLKFRYGSAGGLYPVQAYLLAMPGRIDGLDHGAYYIDPYDHSLRRIGELDGYGPELYDRFVNGPIVKSCAFSIMLALHANAIEPMYGDRALEYALIESGLMAQLLETEGPNEGIGFCQIGGMNYDPVYPILKLNERDRLIYNLLGGGIPSGDPPRFFSWKEGVL